MAGHFLIPRIPTPALSEIREPVLKSQNRFQNRVPGTVFGRPFVKRFALYAIRPLSVCLSCLSLTFVHYGQMVRRIKMKLGMQGGLGPGHIVLDGDPAPLPKGAQPPVFGPYLLRANDCMYQDVT